MKKFGNFGEKEKKKLYTHMYIFHTLKEISKMPFKFLEIP